MSLTDFENITQKSENRFILEDDIHRVENSKITEFNGVLDGNGYTIKNMFVDVFIEDLNGVLKNIDFEVKNTEYLIETNNGQIKNCTINTGLCRQNNGFIVNCSVTEGHLCTQSEAGLISKHNYGKIQNCKTDGSVYGKKAAGGICGKLMSEGVIDQCTSSATVESQNSAGGLIGMAMGTQERKIQQCKFSGKIDSYGQNGIFIGNTTSDIIYKNCESLDVKITADEVKTFSNTRKITDCTISVYLQDIGKLFYTKDLTIHDSTISFKIENISQFLFSHLSYSMQFSNSLINITAIVQENQSNIDIHDSLSINSKNLTLDNTELKTNTKTRDSEKRFVSTEQELYECNKYDSIILQDDITITTRDEPICNTFYGTFDGNEYTIQNLQNPLFNRVSLNATISNVTVKNSYITEYMYRDRIGLIARYNKGEVSNITIYKSIIEVDRDEIGGIVGSSNGLIRDSTVEDTLIIGDLKTGGIAGVLQSFKDLTVKDSKITGGNKVGGIFGRGEKLNNQQTQTEVKNSTITGTTEVGGIGGWSSQETNTHIVTDSLISGSDMVGGIIGTISGELQNASVIKTTITGKTTIGGIIGESNKFHNRNVKINRCHVQNSEIIGNRFVSGLIGSTSNSEITNCSATGSVEGEEDVAGLISTGNNTIINKTYCTNHVSGEKNVAAFVRDIHTVTITDCFTTSTVNSEKPFITHDLKNYTISGLYWYKEILDNPDDKNIHGNPIYMTDVEQLKTLLI